MAGLDSVVARVASGDMHVGQPGLCCDADSASNSDIRPTLMRPLRVGLFFAARRLLDW